MAAGRCKIHDRPLVCPSCMGAKGGRRKSADKARTAKQNAKKGGRPRESA